MDGPAIDTLIRAAARTSRGTLAQPVTTCTPVEVTSVHGSSFVPNSRLARIENGQVACMHVDDMTIAACAFSTAPGSASGEWLESPEGTFALVGQTISLAGIPGGAYVVAAKASDTAPASCVEGIGMDTNGLIETGHELSPTCVVEDLLAQWNNLWAWGWYPLLNYADREVCSSDRIHPDGAVLVRSYPASGSGPDDTFCYTGFGAALNDINGTERDFFGVYIPGEFYCHWLVNAGYESPR